MEEKLSFSKQIKEELEKLLPTARHCRIAELSAMIKALCKSDDIQNGEGDIFIVSENGYAVRKCFTLLRKTYNMYKDLPQEETAIIRDGQQYSLTVRAEDGADEVRSTIFSDIVTQNACCRRAYIRGLYLACGTISDPEKSYHLEFRIASRKETEHLTEILKTFEIEAKETVRNKYYAVYIKEGSQIVETLNVIGAHIALMEYENARIIREMRNSLNRKVNCEAANIGKTVSASVRMASDIRLLMKTEEYKQLPDTVKEIAELRLKYPDASLKELGELTDPPIGKSGVNHRLRRIGELAERIVSNNM